MKTVGEDERALEEIFDLLWRAKKLNGRAYKTSYFKRRLAIRMRSCGVERFSDYVQYLRRHPEEMDLLWERLTIHVTEFFRDKGVFERLKSLVFPFLLQEYPEETWKLWSVGCSSGEEVYSTALVLDAFLKQKRSALAFQIKATDIDAASLQRGRQGCYPLSAMEKIPPAYRDVLKVKGETFQIALPLNRRIFWVEEDALKPLPADARESVHLILCRNLLIYFTKEQHKILFQKFHDALKPKGFLVLGKTEALLGENRLLFQCVDVESRVYQKTEKVGGIG